MEPNTGTGNKNLTWSGKHITVRSINGAENCIIDCENSGKGFYFNNTGQNNSDVIMGFTIRRGNASDGGAGIYCYNSSPIITNCIIVRNSSTFGGGIFCGASSPFITNCIITENIGYGIYSYIASPSINYNDVWNNSPGNYYGYSHQGHDISADPQFVSSNDFHLQPTSPCIDAGTNTAPGIPSIDKDGKPRIINGTVDMGAYEYQGPFTAIHISPSSGPVGTIITIEGQNFATNTSVSIDFGTNITITTTQSSINGTFSTIFIVDTQPPCTKVITATDADGNKATTIFFLIPNPQITQIAPISGEVGTIVTIKGEGFGPNTPVTIDFG
jgi:hypothetical protein